MTIALSSSDVLQLQLSALIRQMVQEELRTALAGAFHPVPAPRRGAKGGRGKVSAARQAIRDLRVGDRTAPLADPEQRPPREWQRAVTAYAYAEWGPGSCRTRMTRCGRGLATVVVTRLA